MLLIWRSLKDLSYKLTKFQLKIAFCAISSSVRANRLNQISQVLTCHASLSIAHKSLYMLGTPSLSISYQNVAMF